MIKEMGGCAMNPDLLVLVESRMKTFSKGQRLIANYIIRHYDKAAFMTASKLGATVGVSESTVVRFATELEFDGYPQLQRALQELIRNKLTSVQRMAVTSDRIGNTDVLSQVLGSDIDKIRKTLEETSAEDFYGSVEEIVQAKTLYLLGIRSAAAIAQFMSFYLNLILPSVRLISANSASEMFEQLLRIGPGDILLSASFPRYSSRTAKAMLYAKSRGAKTIALTDSNSAPIARHADYVLLAKSDMASFVDSLVAPLSLVNALIVAVGLSRKEEVEKTFTELEHIWDLYEVYEKTEDTQH